MWKGRKIQGNWIKSISPRSSRWNCITRRPSKSFPVRQGAILQKLVLLWNEKEARKKLKGTGCVHNLTRESWEKAPRAWYLEFIFHLIAKLPAVCSIFAPELTARDGVKCPLHLADFTRWCFVDKFFRSLVSKREALMLYKIKKKLGILRNVEITANIKLSQSREFIYQQHE